MTPDTMRIEAGLMARNQAQAAQSRSSGENFSSALEQVSRGLSENRPAESTTKTASESEIPVRNASERQAQTRERETRPSAERRPESAQTPKPSGQEHSAKATEKTTPPQSREAAELKRILQRIQQGQTRAAMPGVPAQTGPTEAEAALAAGGAIKPVTALKTPEDAQALPAEASLAGLLLPHAETEEKPGQPHGMPHTATLHHGSDEGLAAQKGRGQPLGLTPGLATAQSRTGAQALDDSAGRGAASPAQRTTGPVFAKTSSSGAQTPSSEAAWPLGAAHQRGQEAALPAEANLRIPHEAVSTHRSSPPDAATSGSAPASLLAGAFPSGQATGAPSTAGATPTFQAGPEQWALPFAPGESLFSNALGERLSWMVRDGLQQAEITLNPQELGPIRIALTMEGDAAQLGIQAEHALTRQAIEEALPQLKSLLADQGVQLGQTAVGQGSGRDPQADDRQDSRQGQARGHDHDDKSGAASLADGRVRAGQMGLRSPGSGRIDVFA